MNLLNIIVGVVSFISAIMTILGIEGMLKWKRKSETNEGQHEFLRVLESKYWSILEFSEKIKVTNNSIIIQDGRRGYDRLIGFCGLVTLSIPFAFFQIDAISLIFPLNLTSRILLGIWFLSSFGIPYFLYWQRYEGFKIDFKTRRLYNLNRSKEQYYNLENFRGLEFNEYQNGFLVNFFNSWSSIRLIRGKKTDFGVNLDLYFDFFKDAFMHFVSLNDRWIYSSKNLKKIEIKEH